MRTEEQHDEGRLDHDKAISHRNLCMDVTGGKATCQSVGGSRRRSSLLGDSGKWNACVWLVVQLDHDQKMGPKHGMRVTLDAELEVQRIVKRAGSRAFFCLLRRMNGVTTAHVHNFPLSPQKDARSHHGSCGQQRNHR